MKVMKVMKMRDTAVLMNCWKLEMWKLEMPRKVILL
jgi:hypothetical protein